MNKIIMVGMQVVSALLLATASLQAATVSELLIPSAGMKREIPVSVILPEGYEEASHAFPVLYLLHGAGGDHTSWPKMTRIAELADQYNVIVCCPKAGRTSWYFDSPVDPDSQMETFVATTCVDYMDNRFRTRRDRNNRALAGLSMGGHGALYLATRHRERFRTAVALSGGVDIRPFSNNWNLKGRLGPIETHRENWEKHTVINVMKDLKEGELSIALDCGDRDFFLEVNRALHAQLLADGISHDYAEHPGEHKWPYWAAGIERQFPFIVQHFAPAPLLLESADH